MTFSVFVFLGTVVTAFASIFLALLADHFWGPEGGNGAFLLTMFILTMMGFWVIVGDKGCSHNLQSGYQKRVIDAGLMRHDPETGNLEYTDPYFKYLITGKEGSYEEEEDVK